MNSHKKENPIIMIEYLKPTPSINSDNMAVVEFARKNSGPSPDPRKQAISLYYAVRDEIRYDPYTIEMTAEGLSAGRTLHTGKGWCVPKAILLAATCRAIGVPARLGFADVRNHLSTKRMRELMKTDVFFWHGYTSIYLNNIWVKATPAFNIELCKRFRINPLDFDGKNDSLYHPFDLDGKKHMEYLRHHGEFADVPIDQMAETFQREYVFTPTWNRSDFDSETEN